MEYRKMEFEQGFNEDKAFAQKAAKASGSELSEQQADGLVTAAYKTIESLALVNNEMTRVFGPNWLDKGQAECCSGFEPDDEGSTSYRSYWNITDIREGSESYGLPLLVQLYAPDGDIENARIISAVVPRPKKPYEI